MGEGPSQSKERVGLDLSFSEECIDVKWSYNLQTFEAFNKNQQW